MPSTAATLPGMLSARASALAALRSPVRPLDSHAPLIDALGVARWFAASGRGTGRVLHAAAAAAAGRGGVVPAALCGPAGGSSAVPPEPGLLLLAAAAEEARLRPAFLLEDAGGRSVEDALAAVATWAVRAASAGEFDKASAGALSAIARSRFPRAETWELVRSPDMAARAVEGLRAAGSLAKLAATVGPPWAGPSWGDCIEAAEVVEASFTGEDPEELPTGGVAQLLAVGAGSDRWREQASPLVAAALDLHGLVTAGRCWTLDSWAAASCGGDGGVLAARAFAAACAKRFPAWVDSATGALGPDHSVVVACVLAHKTWQGFSP